MKIPIPSAHKHLVPGSVMFIFCVSILLITGVVNSSCKKSGFEDFGVLNKNSRYTLSFINNNLPDLTPKQKKLELIKLTEFSLNRNSNNMKSTVNIPIITARWLLETTINTNFANLYDSSLYDFSKDSVDFSMEIVGYSPNGEQLISTDEVADNFNLIKSRVELINQTENFTFYLASIQLVSIENAIIHVRTILSKARTNQNSFKSSQFSSHMPWVLNPWQTPVPFNSNESYAPIAPDWSQRDMPVWAGYFITQKLMANRGRLDLINGEYIIEMKYPFLMEHYIDLYPYPELHDIYWHSVNYVSSLNAAELNTFLTNYKSRLDHHNIFQQDNIHMSEIYVYYTNTFEMWPEPTGSAGIGQDHVHYCHYIKMWFCEFVYVGNPS